MQPAPRKLLDRVRDAVRLKHFAYSTEQTTVQWIKRFILFHDKRHPEEMGCAKVGVFLTHLAVQENVAASTQNQAFSAVLFLYRNVLHRELDFPIDALRGAKPKRLPTILTKQEARQVIGHLSGLPTHGHAALWRWLEERPLRARLEPPRAAPHSNSRRPAPQGAQWQVCRSPSE